MQRTRLVTRSTPLAVAIAGLLLGSCGGSLPGVGKADKVDPNACGGFSAHEAGKKIKAFLEATVKLEDAIMTSENYLLDTCKEMAAELGVSAEGDTKTVCGAVEQGIKDNLEVGLKAEAKAELVVKPAVCEVNLSIAAEAAASCEGKAKADVKVTCEGGCSGTCEGTCDGTCEGSAGSGGSGGECNGQCSGTCKGQCSAGCDGSADVEASAECRAKASVEANASVECTPPEVTFTAEAGIVVDTTKVEAAKKAIELGFGRIAAVQRKAAQPLAVAMIGWVGATAQMSKAVGEAADKFGKQSLCVGGQIKAALDLQSRLQASLDVQVSVSVSVSASASGSAGGGAGAGADAPIE